MSARAPIHRNKTVLSKGLTSPREECRKERKNKRKGKKRVKKAAETERKAEQGEVEGPGGRLLPALPSSRWPRVGGRVASPPLTRPEQHGPVEPRGLGGPPCPLAQPLRHAPTRPTAERSLRAGSAQWNGVRSPSVSAAVTRPRGPNPAADQVTSAARAPGTEAPRSGRGQGQGQVSPPWQRAVRRQRPARGRPAPRFQGRGENPVS